MNLSNNGFLIIKKEPFIFNAKLNYDPKLII
jgi:hypothetical protein